MTTYWTDPATPTGSDAETRPLTPKIRVERHPEPTNEGWHSWVVVTTNGTRRHHDTFPEALNYAEQLAIVNTMFKAAS